MAVTAHTALGLRDVSRTDLIVDGDGLPYFLEVNVAPGMTETSLLPMAVEAAGRDFGTLCRVSWNRPRAEAEPTVSRETRARRRSREQEPDGKQPRLDGEPGLFHVKQDYSSNPRMLAVASGAIVAMIRSRSSIVENSTTMRPFLRPRSTFTLVSK